MSYQQHYSEDRFIKDLSFVLIGPGDLPLAICPLYVEDYDGLRRFSYRGEFLQTLRTPLINMGLMKKQRKTIEKELYKKIDELAVEYKIRKCNFLIDPLCAIYEDEHYNHLTPHGYIDNSIATQIINLKKSREELWLELRKSYKALINTAEKTFEIIVMDFKNPEFEEHEKYRALHFKAAGRVTRPIETFNLQFAMLKNDEAMLIGIKYKGQYVGLSYFIHLNRTAYYASEADDPDIEIPLTCGPLMQWKAIEYYKARGFDYMELDIQQYGSQVFDHPTQKEISISIFKRGFGGKTFPLFRGIRYYDKKLLEKEVIENAEKLIKELSEYK
jgi:hypothetical protein